MTRITGADQILLLLRERLSRAASSDRSRVRPAARSDLPPLERLRALAAFDGLDDDEQRRALLHGILAQELGDAVANDPAFQTMTDDVMRIIAEMSEGKALIDKAIAALRGT